MQYFIYILAAFVIILLLVLLESCRESRMFKTTRYQHYTEKLSGRRKIIFLSDLHNHVYGADNKLLLDSIRQEKPDYILIGGDLIVGKPGADVALTAAFVKRLPDIAPVYYALGNHEQRMKECLEKYGTVMRDYIEDLRSNGIHFLQNESVLLKNSGGFLRITGVELPLYTYDKFKIRRPHGELVQQCAGRADKNVFQILLAHNPVYFSAYKEWGADLVFSGHLHGGIARIPGWRGVITPQAFLFPKYSGEMTTEGSHTIIVSKGLGTHTFNFRIFNPPELVVLELNGTKK